jgi:HEPN domain-containing protein
MLVTHSNADKDCVDVVLTNPPFGGIAVAKTHELKNLLTALGPHHPALTPLKRGLEFLTRFAVETRYPGEDATKREADAALRWAERVRTAARTLLGIRPPRKQ